MNKFMLAVVAFGALAGSAASLRAQEPSGPPQVVVMIREDVKFGKDAGHQKNEAAFARAMASLKRTDHYIGTTTMSGPDQAIFFTLFDSFAQWEAAEKQGDEAKSRALLDPLVEKDADYASAAQQIVLTYNDKWSYRPAVDISQMRYFEVETFRIRPGRRDDWDSLVALYNAAAAKINLDEHDAIFEVAYGAPNRTVLVITPRKSLAEIDAAVASEKALDDALGADGQEKMAQLSAAAIESSRSELLRFDPAMSYPRDSWVQSDPAFWKPKPAAKPAAKAPAKPAAANQ